MNHEFALDLKVARRKSGLTQDDCAHLLAVHPSKVSLLESGKTLPTIRDIAVLTLIYGRSFESLFQGIIAEVQRELRKRLSRMPEAPNRWLLRFNRQATLNALADRLEILADEGYEAA
jgi:transcriptional regulator with XRE-family HTH domain